MPPTQSYFFNILAVGLGMLYITYVIYGRIKRKPLFGDTKPKEPGYAEFLKLINNAKLLAMVITGSSVAMICAILDAVKIVEQNNAQSILIVAPIAVITGLTLVAIIVPRVLKSKWLG